jgi:hypothetical protein
MAHPVVVILPLFYDTRNRMQHKGIKRVVVILSMFYDTRNRMQHKGIE